MEPLAAKRVAELARDYHFKIVARRDEKGRHEWVITCRICERLDRKGHTWTARRDVDPATGHLESDISVANFNNLKQHAEQSTRKHRDR